MCGDICMSYLVEYLKIIKLRLGDFIMYEITIYNKQIFTMKKWWFIQ